ncbi:ammonium transporter, Amt family, partial [Phenoliferia sp. Uapishka_3]
MVNVAYDASGSIIASYAPGVQTVYSTLVYDPVACWTWNPQGWGFKFGALDFAGGGPVHMTSGTAALVMGIYLGRRRGYGTDKLAYRPHSVSHIVLGTDGGSALAANYRAAMACYVSNLAAATGGLTWLLIDFWYTRHWSAVSLCSGIITGLIGITPAAQLDTPTETFAAVTGLFADSRVTSLDGFSEIPGGWINLNYRQLGVQLANGLSIISYSAVMTLIILLAIDFTPGLALRASEEAEIIGIDEDQCGETGYDYVFHSRDIENPHEHAEYVRERSASVSSSAQEKGGAMGTPALKQGHRHQD